MTNAERRKPTYYTIRIRGHISPRWSAWFEGFAITNLMNGESEITGPVRDQAALHGLLAKVRDLNLTLISVIPLKSPLHKKRNGEEMKNNSMWIFRLFFVIVISIICGIVGWLIGAYIGGNYAVDFTFNGVRGYEAMGKLGFLLGFISSVVPFSIIIFKPFRKNDETSSQHNQS